MKEHLSTVLITAVVFAGGLLVGIWMQRFKPLPPPPMPVMGEFPDLRARMRTSQGWFGAPHFFRMPRVWTLGDTSENVRYRLAVLRPEIRAYRGKVEGIEDQFRDQFEAILSPEQRQELTALSTGPGAEAMPSFIAMIIYRPALEHFSRALKLDVQQQKQLEDLMRARRRALLALMDRDPPPSLRLGAVLPGSPKPLPPAS